MLSFTFHVLCPLSPSRIIPSHFHTEQAFYRSFPTTLFMNIPYGCVMVAVNESLKRVMRPAGDYDTRTFLLAGSGAGAIAAVATNPLDVVKTRLQTQALRAASSSGAAAGLASGESVGGMLLPHMLRAGGASAGAGVGGGVPQPHGFGPVLGAGQGTGIHSAAPRCATGRCGADKPAVKLQYQGLVDAVSANMNIRWSYWHKCLAYVDAWKVCFRKRVMTIQQRLLGCRRDPTDGVITKGGKKCWCCASMSRVFLLQVCVSEKSDSNRK